MIVVERRKGKVAGGSEAEPPLIPAQMPPLPLQPMTHCAQGRLVQCRTDQSRSRTMVHEGCILGSGTGQLPHPPQLWWFHVTTFLFLS